MKFDMHCHTKAGSIDAKVPLERYIEILKEKGFGGMLVTDHDSYRGYRKWFMSGGGRRPEARDFTVLCGIEYDTRDAGHFIVILPDGIMPPILRLRGMSVRKLIGIVHMLGGILGPAHPFGTRSASAMFFKKFKKDPELMKKLDFVEGFNTCESSQANMLAVELAKKYGKPCIGGSDSHEERYIGMAYTEIEGKITCNNDMINAVRQGKITDFGGEVREQTAKAKHKEAFYSVWGFKAYNRGLGLVFSPLRKIRFYRGHH
ncbi:MAG: PHP-associated domain-containing protein [Anaerovoracaceae bacterium]